MGNSLKKTGRYMYELDQYSKVPLTSLSDDSDEEDMIYGHKVNNGNLELKLMPPQNGLPLYKSKPEPKVMRPDPKTKTVVCWVCCILTICVAIAVVGAVRWSHNDNPQHNSSIVSYNDTTHKFGLKQPINVPISHQSSEKPKGKDWEKLLVDYGSESCVRLVDVDDDGVLDILITAAGSQGLSSVFEETNLTLEEICKNRHLKYPCLGMMFAYRGTDGEAIWQIYTRFAGIFMNCEDFDINKDGKKDCIVTGRRATVQAIDARNGKTLWFGDEKLLKPTWNIYHPLALPDFDNDGVPEILIVNGGDPSKEPDDHNRKSGRLMILSGASGKLVGYRFLAAPNDKEIYMSPVMYTAKDGSQYILFGSGGETIPGDFMIISVPDLYRYVNYFEHDSMVPGVKGQYDQWDNIYKDINTGIRIKYKGTKKGVMVPPVIVDMNKDGTDDILVSAYEGKMLLLNGEDLSTMWTVDFENMESYTSPAPGYFNDDDVLDFMVHWSVGAWPVYTMTQNYIIDGKDGSLLLILNSTEYQMSSDLSLHTTQEHRDMFIFKIRGRGSHIYMDDSGRIHGLDRTDKGPPSKEIPVHNKKPSGVFLNHGNHGPLGNPPSGQPLRVNKRHGEPPEDNYLRDESLEEIFEDYSSRHFLCTDNIDIKSELLLFDRTTINSPIKLTETRPQNFNYTVPSHTDGGRDVTICVVITPDDRTTAAIGDVDGDGILDIVSLVGLMGEKVDSGYSYKETVFWTYLKKISLGTLIKEKSSRVSADVQAFVSPSTLDKDLAEIDILPLDKQKWTQYMGTKGNGHYVQN